MSTEIEREKSRAHLSTLSTFGRVMIYLAINQVRFRQRHGNHYLKEERTNPWNPISWVVLFIICIWAIITGVYSIMMELSRELKSVFSWE